MISTCQLCRASLLNRLVLGILVPALALSAYGQSLPSRIGDLDGDGQATVLDLVQLINYLGGNADVLPNRPGVTLKEREAFADVDQNGVVDQRDEDALTDAILEIRSLPPFPPATITETSPANSEESVSPTRTVILRFSRRIDPTTINSNNFYLIANGERLAGRIEVSSTEKFATFFPTDPFPASTEIRILVDGSLILDRWGLSVDVGAARTLPAASQTLPAVSPSVGYFDFRTLPLFRIPGTAVSGYVYDSYRTNADGSNVPIIGATIRVDAFPEANAVTDSRGHFTLTNVPAPEFFVHIDGSTAVNAPVGAVYPSGGKLFHSVPGLSTQMPQAFSVYLPPMAQSDVVLLSPNRAIDVFFGPAGLAELARMFPTNDQAAFRRVCVTFPPGSAVDDVGHPATQATIVPVPPGRLPSPLPSNLTPKLVISVQAPGATRFDVPAPVIFPNLDGLNPGEKALFFSYNHAAGRWDIVGTGTATTNGTIATDPGVGIRAPGWHLVQVGTATAGQPCEIGKACARFLGKHGDIIEIDLRPTAPNRFQGFAIQPTGGGTFFKEDDGLFYFAPLISHPSSSPAMPAGGNPKQVNTTFTVTLFGNSSDPDPDPKSGCVRTSPTTVRCTGELQIQIDDGYSPNVPTTSNPLPAMSRLDVLRVEQRLRYLGFAGAGGQVLGVSGSADSNARWATGLFNAAILGFGPLNSQPTFVNNAINSPDAPRWIIDGNLSGTHWAKQLVAVAQSRFAIGTVTSISDPPGGQRAIDRQNGTALANSEHQQGMDVDIDVPEVFEPGPYFFCTDGLTGTVLARTLNMPNKKDAGELLLRIGSHYELLVQPLRAPPPQTWKVLNGSELIGEEGLLTAAYLSGLLLDNPRYNRTRLKDELLTVQNITTPSRAGVGEIYWNDPYFYNELGLTRFVKGHNGHYHVNVIPPSLAPAPVPAPPPMLPPTASVPIPTNPGFGSDTRLYYRFKLANGFELAGHSSMDGTFTEILSPNTDYTLTLYRPADNRWAVYNGRSNSSGQATDLGTLILDHFGGVDSDGDGIPDQGEFALGTRADLVDSDGDGITDDAELAEGLDPNSGRSFPTGIIASLPLRGEAKEVVVEGNLAYVATGSYGLAIVDVGRFDQPIIIGQLKLKGDATDVVVVPALKIAVVTTGSGGLQLVDVSNPMQAVVARSLGVNGTRVEVFATVAYVTTGASLTAVDLLTGHILQTLPLGVGLTDVALEGSFLYTMDLAGRLQALELINFAMANRGSLNLAEGGGRLFVGNHIAYVAAASTAAVGGGFSTVSVSSPTNLVLISNPDRQDGRPSAAIVANGSGLGALVGTIFPTSPSTRQPRFYVMDLRDPSNTDNALTYYVLPSGPQSVTLASGIGFVANGTNGLTVVNYRPFDNAHVPPLISLEASFSLDPPQAEEGKAARLSAVAADDVQVRDVEFYINGVQVTRDVSFPFEHRFVTPARTGKTNSFRIRAKATDTGGNTAWSDEYEVALFADLTPPEVIRVSPSPSSVVSGVNQITAYFDEPLKLSTLSEASFHIDAVGADGRPGTSDDVTVPNGAFSYYEQASAVALRFPTNLARGVYHARLSAPLSDRADNIISTFDWLFLVLADETVCSIPSPTCPDSDGDGLSDAVETLLGTSATSRDTDGDGLSDFDEVFKYGTNPREIDTDGDGWPDGLEIRHGTSPLDSNNKPALRVSASSLPVSEFNITPEPGPTYLFLSSPVVTYENK